MLTDDVVAVVFSLSRHSDAKRRRRKTNTKIPLDETRACIGVVISFRRLFPNETTNTLNWAIDIDANVIKFVRH